MDHILTEAYNALSSIEFYSVEDKWLDWFSNSTIKSLLWADL